MAQLLYELCFCLWSVSLCDDTKQDFMSCGAIPILAQQVLYTVNGYVLKQWRAGLIERQGDPTTSCRVDHSSSRSW